jgi:hypothetical protein
VSAVREGLGTANPELARSDALLSGILEAVTRLVEHAEASVNGVNLTTEHAPRQRVSPKLQMALAWLENHPEHLDTPSRQLRDAIGVSHTTVHKAQQMLKDAGEES